MRNNAFKDQTRRSVTLMTWTDVESSVYLITACLTCLRPLMRAIAHQQIFKKHFWSKDIQFTSDEHARPKTGANLSFSGANRFWWLNGAHGDVSEVERGQQSVRAISRADMTQKEDIELAQVTKIGQIRVTNDIQVYFTSDKAHTREQEIANNQ